MCFFWCGWPASSSGVAARAKGSMRPPHPMGPPPSRTSSTAASAVVPFVMPAASTDSENLQYVLKRLGEGWSLAPLQARRLVSTFLLSFDPRLFFNFQQIIINPGGKHTGGGSSRPSRTEPSGSGERSRKKKRRHRSRRRHETRSREPDSGS